jgi:membrane protein
MDANNAVVDLARRVKDEMAGNNLTLVAAGVAFYSLLAVFPAIIGVVTVYALVSSPSQVEGQIRPLLTALPPDAAALLLNRLTLAVEANGGGLTVGLVVSLVATVWAATGGVSALMTGLNIISGVPEGRNFIKLRGLALGLTFGALVGAAVALGLVAAFPVVLDRIGLDPAATIGAQAARWVTLVAVVLLGLSACCTGGARTARTPGGGRSASARSSRSGCGCSRRSASRSTSATSAATTRRTAASPPSSCC